MNKTTQIFTILVEHNAQKRISFNSNFLEANVINILLLLFGLIYVLKQFLGSVLSIRQDKVLSAIQEAEERLQQANLRLEESEKQLAQAKMVVVQIKEEAKLTAKKVRESILEQGELDIERLTAASKTSIANAENQVRQQIQQQIISLAINRVATQLRSQVTPTMQLQIIDNGIAQLGGKI
uniref:ATP synthase CF0 subunit I n=1 Tax=Catenella fusiformis TaxID=3024791 RepID=UPI0027DA4028|nr:ATP synthase CF0 subunit I [Catenella fusiformis]WCH57516.1 ATP synthase CF0 subunit I [Catenella fusiformis]